MSRSLAPPRVPDDLTEAQMPGDDLADDALLRALHFTQQQLDGRTAYLVDIEGCRFERTSMHGCTLEKLTMSDCLVEDCDLANLRLVDSSWHRCAVRRTRLTGWDFAGGTLRHVRLEDCAASLLSLRFAVCHQAEFVNCNLSRADLTDANLHGARFEGCDLTGAQFHGANMQGARLVGCRLDGVLGIQSLAGATIAPHDLLSLTYSLAGALDIAIAEEEPPAG